MLKRHFVYYRNQEYQSNLLWPRVTILFCIEPFLNLTMNFFV